MLARALFGVLLVGCAGAPDPAAPPEQPADDTLQRVTDLLQLAVDEAARLDGRDLQSSYETINEYMDAGCPYLYATYYWFGGCESGMGATFDGYVSVFTEYGQVGDDYWQLYGQANVQRPSGENLELSGYAGWGTTGYGGLQYDYSYAYGTFHDEQANKPAWLAEGRSMAIIKQVADDGNGNTQLYIEGSLGSLGGDVAQAADFFGIALQDPGFPGEIDCTGQVTGALGVRLPEGRWIDVFFDECTGCGEAFHGEEELGEVCPDFSSWNKGVSR